MTLPWADQIKILSFISADCAQLWLNMAKFTLLKQRANKCSIPVKLELIHPTHISTFAVRVCQIKHNELNEITYERQK